jgi:hypothetical protein
MSVAYLALRRAMLNEASCQARVYLIGSGAVESTNTLVVET